MRLEIFYNEERDYIFLYADRAGLECIVEIINDLIARDVDKSQHQIGGYRGSGQISEVSQSNIIWILEYTRAAFSESSY